MNLSNLLEPLLIILGQGLYDIEEWHTNRWLEWSIRHPHQHEKYSYNLGWGVNPQTSLRLWIEGVNYGKRMYQEKNHTLRDVVLWYQMTYFWSKTIKAKLFGDW